MIQLAIRLSRSFTIENTSLLIPFEACIAEYWYVNPVLFARRAKSLKVYGGSDGFSFVHYLQRDYRTLGSLRFLFTGQFSGTLGEIIAYKSGFLLDNINYGIQRVVWAALSSKKWRDTIITISSAV